MGTLVHSCPNNKETSFILLQQQTVKYSGIIVSSSNFPLRSVKEENFLLKSVDVKSYFTDLDVRYILERGPPKDHPRSVQETLKHHQANLNLDP
jgi:hypothetical protein